MLSIIGETLIPETNLAVAMVMFSLDKRADVFERLFARTETDTWEGPLSLSEARAIWPGGPEGGSWLAPEWVNTEKVPFTWACDRGVSNARRRAGLTHICENGPVSGEEIAAVAGYPSSSSWKSGLGHLSDSCVMARHRPLWDIDKVDGVKRYYMTEDVKALWRRYNA